MKITNAQVFVCSPGRNFVTLKIETDAGITGIGDATVNGRELSVASYLSDHLCPALIGRDASAIEDTWQYFYRGAYWRRGPIGMAAIAAIDVALWDIKAKVANMPLYQLLGGASRNHMLSYSHASGDDKEEVADKVAELSERGFKAIRIQGAVPGMPVNYGVDKPGVAAQAHDRPRETLWDTRSYLRYMPILLDHVRSRFGPELNLLHDVHHRLTPQEAARLARSVEPYDLFWLEDAIPAENQEAFRLIRQHSTTPLAVGEVFNSIHDCRTLIQEGLIDFIRTTPVHAGGITHVRRIADLAGLHHVRLGSHGAADMSPITMGAALHLDRWVPNFGIQEYAFHPPQAQEVFPHDWHLKDGQLFSGEKPGHGVEFDEAAAARFPYDRAYLDVARLSDGTLWNW
ncbi:D-mannonate dehydratase ManD [Sphingomonas melonis]|uniref:Mannonate dehydratase n=1 Tax=Sphingomonas melonis TaxID=152682 RepID=A0A7Y9FKR7_9SPHN|nr:D-mannonate dehydratase ManD [Sphingomonas melonis]NYD89126.1 mannonate dehydratase [Sphingomonas melonis]